ncbi:nephrocystin-4 isoform X1 [Poecilia reticulata]|nr:PREDICTED: nephrocystin-4 isoform X1 [Poecilia reticulata]XP_008411315.1 PREDICTED: nephrocystin-4 isoform X1 [Poecilia reticulata]XP_017161435.1 PREDICTED: nephrocystin-4 isoform X1 [Poecilia reticulata]XP_017161436.1 PREDICTED: nephrocystin-4 isoform X1 [Poecilia reticulata]
MADSWDEVFHKNRLVPPSSQTVRLAVENHLTANHGFQLSFSRLIVAQLPQDLSAGEDVTYQLRVTLFDRKLQHFFGKTWKSSSQKMKNNKISFNEVLYLHTSLLLPSTLVVVELVSLSTKPDGSYLSLGRGFSILELFTNRPEGPGTNGDRRLNLHRGSPRGLLHPSLKDSVDYGNLLKVIDGAHLDCVMKTHPSLNSAVHLLPEHALVSGEDNLPGLIPSPAGDALLRPQLLKMTPFTLDKLTISLQPSLEKFESLLLQLINADCQNTKQPEPEDAQQTVVIQERRLHVGVHNGWCFLDKPQVVVLEPVASGVRGRTDSTSKKSMLVKDSSATSSRPQMLGLRSSLEIKMANNQALAIVFQLEYVFSAPIGRETMLSATSTSRAAFLQCLRWGIWCPFQEPAHWKGKEVQLVLQGGAKPNPLGVMVYSTEASVQTHSNAAVSASSTVQERSEAKDVIRFWLFSSLEKKPSSPRVSLRTKQEDVPRQKSSPSPSRKQITPTSPPESPRGPGLSLSQLAATSRYPTISHSSSALPWQQSFPSLLHPSPLASAHQLSHVACSAVSNITHLEMDLQREGDKMTSKDEEGDHLQELPFTPIHAPVISLGANVPSSCSVSSRSSLAHLFSAGFPEILDCSGQVAEVLDPTEPMPFDPQREEADLLQGNLLVFEFLAFTRIPGAGGESDWPRNIYVTFQFYRFPPVTSQQLKLLTSDKVRPKANEALPCVLATINKDGSVNTGSPGLQIQFRVDDDFLRPREKRWFLRHLALHTMHIDVWDSDSLLLIGSTAMELKYLLRQGKPAVQALHELEILTTDYVEEDTLLPDADQHLRSTSTAMTVYTIVRGRLHIRTGSIGCPADPSRKRAADGISSYSHIITPREVTTTFKGGSLSTRNILQLNARNTAREHRLDGEPVLLNRNGIRAQDITPEAQSLNSDSRRRKLDCMAAVHRLEAKENTTAADVTGLNPATQLIREHQPSDEYSKAEGIANMLSQAITTQHLLYASLGSAEYMEFVLKNPFNVPQTITIHIDDSELSVITDTEEWRYFKAITKTSTPLEENMFHVEEAAPGPRVYLRPKESVHIPLKYQSFLCNHTISVQGPSFLPTGKGSQMAKKTLSNIINAKIIKVTFRAEDCKPMAICQVNVEPTPHVVDQTFRLYHPELCFLKKAIRLPPWQGSTAEDPNSCSDISVHCSDPNIVCQTRMMVPGEPQDVYLKVPGSPSPHIKMFFVMVFTDKWKAAPSQIWQVYVHFLERVDVSCVTGQRTCQSLVLRGKQAVRKIKCFLSHPKEIEVDPAGVFVLPPAAVQELQLRVQPWQAGSRFLYVNAVDMDQKRLFAAWLLCLSVHHPVLSKAFEVSVPAGNGRGSSRKITYTNPYTSTRMFFLRSDHPDLLQFREDKFQIGGGESYTIGLRFAPSQSSGSAEILVYVNNSEEKTEETFCVKVNYS